MHKQNSQQWKNSRFSGNDVYLCDRFFSSNQYLSDNQCTVFARRCPRVVFALIVNDHSFHRLRLSVTQLGRTVEERMYSIQKGRIGFSLGNDQMCTLIESQKSYTSRQVC